MPDFFKIWEFFQVLPRYTLFQKIALFFGLPITIYFVYLLTVGRPPLVTLFLTLSDDYTAQRIPTNAGNLEGYLLRATVAVKNDAPSVAHTVRTIITDVLRVTGQNRLNCTAVLPKAIEVGGAGVDLPGGL